MGLDGDREKLFQAGYRVLSCASSGVVACVVVLDIVVVVVAFATSDNGVVACFGLGGPSDGTGVVDVVVLGGASNDTGVVDVVVVGGASDDTGVVYVVVLGGASDDTGVVAGFAFVALLLLHLAATTPFPSFLPK